jgi:hypothetical protein
MNARTVENIIVSSDPVETGIAQHVKIKRDWIG